MLTGKIKSSVHPQFKEVKITKEMVQMALSKGTDMGTLRNSIRKGEGNAAGFLGEEIVKTYFGVDSNNTYQYDLLFAGKRVEVKTKNTTVIPRINYECSVASYNASQDCDFYVFVRVLDDLSKGWILGYLPKAEFMKKSRFSQKGSYEANNDYTEKASCYKLEASELSDIKTMGSKNNIVSL